ncbi:MAG: 7,8-didemethyl-8-hydroxy-5-deazariboflavin synthase CofG, partial [Rubrivivax sp.]|nr:7,8-didemethyl-8-hydroxy-5-deazariboflavin synthase CofG [Rubrivivax sp.]
MALAAARRDAAFGRVITHSRKVFLPLTQLCRDVCHYCTFAKAPRQLKQPYLGVDEALRIARQGAAMGCREALFTLGERPEDRHPAAREALDAMGFASTLDYLAHVARLVREETGLLPHFNPGTLTAEELARLRPLAPSMGLMLESTSERLCAKGGPHHGSPDKAPALRLQTLEDAGRLAIPFTSGLLIGIGETRAERIETLLALRDAHGRHGHLQEVIVQNFRAKLGTRMAKAPEPSLDELLWTIAAARLLLPTDVSVQVPPNLSPGALPQLLAAGIDDWGGISPLTPDHVNPEAPWPHLQQLAEATAQAGHFLEERLTVYPRFARELPRWVD